MVQHIIKMAIFCDSDGEYIFTIKQNLPLGDKQYNMQEEIDKYEFANR